MKILNLSGAATKISGLFGVCEALHIGGWRPDWITGISSGALLSVPIAMGLLEEIKDRILNLSPEDIFDNPPVNKRGRPTARAVTRVIAGKLSLGTQENLKDTLAGIISEGRFREYKKGNYPQCTISAVDYLSGSKMAWDVKELSYQDYLTLVNASCSIPIYVEPVEYKGMLLYDGGIRDHNAGANLLERLRKEGRQVDEVISVYSRPKDYKPVVVGPPKNVLDINKRIISLMNAEISLNDERDERDLAGHMGSSWKGYYLPRVMLSDYDTDKGRIFELYGIGKKQVG